MKQFFAFRTPRLLATALVLCGAWGCERKEKVLEINTPGAEIEVERSTDSGDIDIHVDDK